MRTLQKLMNGAQQSGLKRLLLNVLLWWKIPFNLPHRPRITAVNENSLTMMLPFRRKNKNHINGIHACALATLCEYITGLSLGRAIDPVKYRFILRRINIEYKFQAKKKVTSTFMIAPSQVASEILVPLQSLPSIDKELLVDVYDIDGKLICNGSILWQIKRWDAVRTKV